MKPVKTSALIALTGLMALVCASSVSAAIHIKSCTKESSCQTATVGTTFEGSTKNFVVRGEGEEGEVVDECESTLTGKVTDPTSTGAEDPLEYLITKNTFANCTKGVLEAALLPWSVVTDQPSYEESGTLEEAGVLITNWLGCGYAEQAPNHLLQVRQDGFSTLLEEGRLRKENGFCLFSLWWYKRTITLFGVNDPNLPGAKSIVIG
jgi:hypothetical protein